MSVGARAAAWAFGPVEAIRIDLFRRAFAFSFLLYMIFRLGDWREWLTAFGYHHDAGTSACMRGDPFPLLPAWAVPIFAALALGSSLSLVLGRWTRVMAIAAAASALYAQRVDEMSAFSMNKHYVVMFTLLALAPSAERLDPARDRSPWVTSAWPVRVVQLALAIQYFTAGACKVIHGVWLEVDDVLYSQLVGTFRTDFAATLLRVLPRSAFSILELATLAFELLAPLALGWRRSRPWFLLVGLVFHAFIALTMYNLFYFSAQIVTYYVVFIDPRALRRLQHRIGSLRVRLQKRLRGRTAPAS